MESLFDNEKRHDGVAKATETSITVTSDPVGRGEESNQS